MKKKSNNLPTIKPVETLVHTLRGKQVMLDRDLAELYGIKPFVLRQQVKRNLNRFPSDFMFRITPPELKIMVSQFVIPSLKYLGGSMPYVFTQEGIAMLSSVLRSPRAVQMNIAIMRAFVKMRELMLTNKEFAVRIQKLEHSHERTGDVIEMIVEDIEKLNKDINWIKNPPVKRKHPIGFVVRKGE